MEEIPGIYHEQLRKWLKADPWRMACLHAVRQVMGENGWIGGGFVRHLVWDHIGDVPNHIIEDVDVVYIGEGSEDQEKVYFDELNALNNEVNWEVRDQTRMAKKHGHNTYADINTALSYWIETCTAVAVRASGQGLDIIAPFGLDDLFRGILRPVEGDREEKMLRRLQEKGWLQQYPFLRVVT